MGDRNKPDNPAFIEVTTTHFGLLSALLPPRYILSLPDQKPRIERPTQKKESEPKAQILPEKRPAREKEPEFLSGKSEQFKRCYRQLASLKKNSISLRFVHQIENSEATEDPVDLKSIEGKLVSGEYLSAFHLCKDIRKMISWHFLNSCRSPDQYLETFEFCQLFESMFKAHENLVFSENLVQDLTKKIERLTSGIKEIQSQIVIPKAAKDKKMTPAERKILCQSLKKLDPKYLSGVLKIVKGSLTNTGEELEFDLEKLPNKVCKELDRYIKQCLQFKPSKKTAAKESGKEISVVSGKRENEVRSESEESSSSSSQSEEELPGVPFGDELWDKDMQDFMSEKF